MAAVPSLITRRQTTFWEFLDANGASRVHFTGKKEFRVADDQIPGIEVVGSHPLLVDYLEPRTSIYVASPSSNPDATLEELREALLTATSGWRDPDTYLNGTASGAVLSQGYGLLFKGPETFGKMVIALLSKAQIDHTVLPGGSASAVPVQVLLAGGNWVVAESFRVEELPSNTSLERTRER